MPNPGVTQYLYLGGIKVDASGSYHIFFYETTLVKGYPTSSASELTNKSGADVTSSTSTGIENVVASPNSIAVDGTGKAHIAYVRNTSIYHAWIESGWQEAVFKTGIDIATAAPAIAAKGTTVGIAYTDAAGKVQFARDSGAGFGAPDQVDTGGAASFAAYPVFGWVLTPLPKTVPKDGSTITVWVDGIQVGDLKTAPNVYDQYRVDVATAFPGLNNSSGPVGAYILDTTAYENGVHTIFWIATDNAGAADGIGSRYFNIVNAGGAEKREEAAAWNLPAWDEICSLALWLEPISVKTGFNLRAEPESLFPDEQGTYHVEIPEVNRIEIDLANARKLERPPARPSCWLGFLRVGEELRPLPIGSTFDARSGRFYWMPGPGFLGSYDLVFTEQAPSGLKKRIQVAVTIKPK